MNEGQIKYKIIQEASRQNRKATEKLVNRITTSSTLDHVVYMLGEIVDHFLKSENFADAYFLMSLKSVSKIQHPHLDYSRIVTLSYCGKEESAKLLLDRAINDYPFDESLKDLRVFLDASLHVKYLYQ